MAQVGSHISIPPILHSATLGWPRYLEVHLVDILLEAENDTLVGKNMMEFLLVLEGLD